MKYFIIAILLLLANKNVKAQADAWTAYWNADTTLYGFKDKNGRIMIAPKFTGMGIAQQFEHIMSVAEEIPGTEQWKSYFLTRTGKNIGFDSLYFFDNAPDCESEGFIRFKDHKLDKVGMLNRDGRVVIPALYNYLDRANNGLVTGLRGATKKQDGEHYSWEGGENILLDTTGAVLIHAFKPPSTINLYDVKISTQPGTDPDRINFKTPNGQYYSFIDYEKEFLNWLNKLVGSLTTDLLKQHVFEEVYYNAENVGWVSKNGNAFIENNYTALSSTLQKLQQPACDSFVSGGGLNPFIYEPATYKKYFDNCNQAMEWKYPQMSVYINQYKEGALDQQESFDFLRTDEGYKLISLNIKDNPFK